MQGRATVDNTHRTLAVPKPAKLTAQTPQPFQTFDELIAFGTTAVHHVQTPWKKTAIESIIQIAQYFEVMKVDEETSRSLVADIEALLYIVIRTDAQKLGNEIVEGFKRRIQTMRDGLVAPHNSRVRLINAEQTKDIISGLRQDLDGAVRLLQTGLQISLAETMEKVKNWKAGIQSGDGDIVKNLSNMTYNAKGNLKLKADAKGIVSSTIKGSNFRTSKSYTQHTQGSSVTETLEGSRVDADDDIDISTIATGTWF